MAEKSLSKLCLEAIAEHIALCSKNQVNGLLTYSYVDFPQLSDNTIQEILDIGLTKEVLSPEYFALLIHKNVLKLDFSRYQSSVTDQVLLQLRCKKLISLNLKNCSQISSSCLNQVVQDLAYLTCINLSRLECSNSVVENLAKHCPNLRELDLESCGKITDSGIEAVLKDGSSAAPLKITYLNLSSTSVSTKSLWICLNRLPSLVSLSLAKTKNIAEESEPCYTLFMQDKTGPFQLRYLDISDTLVFNSHLRLVLQRCPELVELKLSAALYTKGDPESFSQSLLHLLRLKALQINGTLSHPYFERRQQAFKFERLQPFLKQNGHLMECLNLTNVKGISLLILCLYCKSLKRLVLSNCELVRPFFPSWKISSNEVRNGKRYTECDAAVNLSEFCQLKYIQLEKVEFKDISLRLKQDLLYQLLASHANLLQLSLKNVPIEERFLLRILQGSSGAQLEKLVLSCYDNVTVKTIRMIEDSCPSLKCLELFHCWIITWYDIWQINDRLKRNRKKLEVVEQNDLIFMGS